MRIISQNGLLSIPFKKKAIMESQEVSEGVFRVWMDDRIMGDYGSQEEAAYVIEQISVQIDEACSPDHYVGTIRFPGSSTSRPERKTDDSWDDADLDRLDMSRKSTMPLRRSGIKTVGQLRKMSIKELRNIRNIGQKSIDEITEAMRQNGLWN